MRLRKYGAAEPRRGAQLPQGASWTIKSSRATPTGPSEDPVPGAGPARAAEGFPSPDPPPLSGRPRPCPGRRWRRPLGAPSRRGLRTGAGRGQGLAELVVQTLKLGRGLSPHALALVGDGEALLDSLDEGLIRLVDVADTHLGLAQGRDRVCRQGIGQHGSASPLASAVIRAANSGTGSR